MMRILREDNVDGNIDDIPKKSKKGKPVKRGPVVIDLVRIEGTDRYVRSENIIDYDPDVDLVVHPSRIIDVVPNIHFSVINTQDVSTALVPYTGNEEKKINLQLNLSKIYERLTKRVLAPGLVNMLTLDRLRLLLKSFARSSKILTAKRKRRLEKKKERYSLWETFSS